jgi:hypothetical protein
MGWTNPHAVALFRTLRQVSDPLVSILPPDRAARCGFYLAIARSAVWASPFLRNPSPNCERAKNRPSTPAADSAQVRCSRYVESLVAAHALGVARLSKVRTQELRRLCPLFADRAQEGGKPTGLGRTW